MQKRTAFGIQYSGQWYSTLTIVDSTPCDENSTEKWWTLEFKWWCCCCDHREKSEHLHLHTPNAVNEKKKRIPKTKKAKNQNSLTFVNIDYISASQWMSLIQYICLARGWYVSWFQNINSICIMILGAFFFRSLVCHLIQLKRWNPFVENRVRFFFQIHKCSMIGDWIFKLSHYQCLTLTNTPPTWRNIRKKSWIEITRFQSFLCMNTWNFFTIIKRPSMWIRIVSCFYPICHPSIVKWLEVEKYIAILCNTLNWISPEWLIVFDLIWQWQQAFRPNSIHNLIQFLLVTAEWMRLNGIPCTYRTPFTHLIWSSNSRNEKKNFINFICITFEFVRSVGFQVVSNLKCAKNIYFLR